MKTRILKLLSPSDSESVALTGSAPTSAAVSPVNIAFVSLALGAAQSESGLST